MSKKELGQYFTVNEDLQKYVFKVSKNNGLLLEPSFGAGHLLKQFLKSNPDYPMVCCELDKKIEPCVTFNSNQTVIYDDFIKTTFTQSFATIIGNPPYVKKEKNRNLYLQFIEKSIGLLDTNGELVFIVPSDFLKLTSAAEIIRKMVSMGSFTDFYFPNNEKLFLESSVDIVVFRYQKDLKTRSCLYNGEERTWHFNEGIITFSSNQEATITLGELFNCYVGFVSGRDKVFCNSLGSLNLLCDKNKMCTFICVDKYPSGNKNVDDYLLANKKELMERKIRNFNEDNWFEWGAIRNKTAIDERMGKPCIYVRTMTRKDEVAFIGTVNYFGGGLLCLCPKVDGLELEPIVKVLNNSSCKQDYIYSGRYKIGQKQVRFIRV